MKVNTKIKPSSLFLDITPNVLLVIDGNMADDPNDKYYSIRNRTDVFKFITRKDVTDAPSSFYFLEEYEGVFYQELRRLLNVIDQNPHLEVYITPIGIFKNDKWDIFHKVIQPKLLAAFKNRDVTFLWDPETIDDALKPFWGFLDVKGQYNIFHKDDVVVPFKHEYAVEYYDIQASNKLDAVERIKLEKDKYVIH